ncbi:hypothetical protein [Bradyrhizobium arachidis]|uniref:hypothetical protein n=1 Tax=Bradyrhizobium arachidis TaxID=858423 RepID=UPI00142E22D7|nr:hypothetical protein [Bradyrhizobium arachidis]
MPKRTPPSDDTPLARRCAFQSMIRDQFEAYQPSGNGSNGHTRWLSLAAFGGTSTNILISGADGVERTATRRHAHCKFIVVVPARQYFSEFQRAQISTSAQNRHASKTARSFSNGARILEKSASAFNQSGQLRTTSKVDQLG